MSLPIEILWNINRFLEPPTYLIFHRTCKQLYQLKSPYRFHLDPDQFLWFIRTAPLQVLELYDGYQQLIDHFNSLKDFASTSDLISYAFVRGVPKLCQLLSKDTYKRTSGVCPSDGWSIPMRIRLSRFCPPGSDNMILTPMQLAAISGNEKVCDILLDAGVDVEDYYETWNLEYMDGWGNKNPCLTPIILAVIFEHLDLVKHLYSKGAVLQPNLDDNELEIEGNPMEIAILEDNPTIFEWLRQMDVHPHPVRLIRLLCISLQRKSNTLDYLIERCQVHEIEWMNELTFCACSGGGNHKLIQIMNDKMRPSQGTKNRAFLSAVRSNELDMVKHMLEIGADIKYKEDANAVEIAVLNGDYDLCLFLVQKLGSQFVSKMNQDIVQIIGLDGSLDMCKLLLEHGAKVGRKQAQDIIVRCILEDRPDLVPFLLRFNPPMHIRRNTTLLTLCVDRAQDDIHTMLDSYCESAPARRLRNRE